MEAPAKKLTLKEKIAQKVEKPKGNRKHRTANLNKEAKKNEVRAVLKNFPSSPQKMRLVADLVRGKSVADALAILSITQRAAAAPLHKLLLSAYNNYTSKFPEVSDATEDLVVKTIFVDGGAMLKRLRPAPQGRAFRVRKRSNHVTIYLESKVAAE